jgi:hypothetical protein
MLSLYMHILYVSFYQTEVKCTDLQLTSHRVQHDTSPGLEYFLLIGHALLSCSMLNCL